MNLLPRQESLRLLHSHIANPRMIQHSLASEAVMRVLARHFGENEEQWAQAGLLHDLDVEFTQADPLTHGPVAAAWLEEKGIDPAVCDAIRMHNEMATGIPRNTRFQHALAAGETITGLITATSMVYPDKSVKSVKPSSVIKRMKEKAFAASVKRENILECEIIGIPLEHFATLAVEAMQHMVSETEESLTP